MNGKIQKRANLTFTLGLLSLLWLLIVLAVTIPAALAGESAMTYTVIALKIIYFFIFAFTIFYALGIEELRAFAGIILIIALLGNSLESIPVGGTWISLVLNLISWICLIIVVAKAGKLRKMN
ncbi:hypothetical protein [Mycoplasmopsis gallinarum]|uniref:hypothetical protein n=1 Tax=Mycoplasmopsis gallinarum TaxID=29557 RepID=UPI0004826584|nr:hypothetical protein [Mycoplasmopsis gallinarum]